MIAERINKPNHASMPCNGDAVGGAVFVVEDGRITLAIANKGR